MKVIVHNQERGYFKLSEEGSKAYCQKKGIPFETVTDEVIDRFGGRTDPDLVEVVEQIELDKEEAQEYNGEVIYDDTFQVVTVADRYKYWVSECYDSEMYEEGFEEIHVSLSDETLRALCSDPDELIEYVHGVNDAIPRYI